MCADKMVVDSPALSDNVQEEKKYGYDNVKDKNHTMISPNQHVLLRLPSEGLKIVQLKSSGSVSLGKFGSFNMQHVLGYPFGQTFEVLGENKVRPIKSMTVQADEENEENEDDEELDKDLLTKILSNSAENNQNIINIGSSIQKLDAEEIDKLKKARASSDIGQKIIEQMIAGHGGFDKKTLFSQQKYLRRKQQKFLRRFKIEYLGGSQLLQYYIAKELPKVLDMSEETMGLILSYANVKPGGKYLLIDETGGVLLYAMMERMNGEGTIVSIHENEHPNHIVLRNSDYSQELQERVIKSINWLQVIEPENEKIDWTDYTEEEVASFKAHKRTQYFRRRKRAHDTNDAIDLVANGNFDALISASTLDLTTVLPHIVDKVGGSRPIVIYSQFKEFLLEAQHHMSSDKRYLAPSMYETKVRNYQTIPGRMHPMMTLKGYGGYVLSATKVIPVVGGVTAVGRGISKRKDVSSTETTPQPDSSKDTTTMATVESQ